MPILVRQNAPSLNARKCHRKCGKMLLHEIPKIPVLVPQNALRRLLENTIVSEVKCSCMKYQKYKCFCGKMLLPEIPKKPMLMRQNAPYLKYLILPIFV